MKIHLLCAVASLMLALLLSSCALSGFATSQRRVPFSESEFAAYRGSGSGTVMGQLVVTPGDGAVHVGSGVHVTLLPVTAYTREMVDREIGDGENLGSSDPRFQKYARFTTTDANGNFAFRQIPAGEYFVCGLGEWVSSGDFQYQWACERVTVRKGESVRIKLTHNLHHVGKPLLVIWALE